MKRGLDTHLNRGFHFDAASGSDGSGRREWPKIFLSVGHDEYWSSAQRRNVEFFRDEIGMNLGFFSGNEAYWNIRWEHGKFDGNHDKDPTTMIVYCCWPVKSVDCWPVVIVCSRNSDELARN